MIKSQTTSRECVPLRTYVRLRTMLLSYFPVPHMSLNENTNTKQHIQYISYHIALYSATILFIFNHFKISNPFFGCYSLCRIAILRQFQIDCYQFGIIFLLISLIFHCINLPSTSDLSLCLSLYRNQYACKVKSKPFSDLLSTIRISLLINYSFLHNLPPPCLHRIPSRSVIYLLVQPETDLPNQLLQINLMAIPFLRSVPGSPELLCGQS